MKPSFDHDAYKVVMDNGVDTVKLEDVYQLFKARMAEEARQEVEGDFPLGPACDLSKEGGCDSCQ